MCYSFDNCYRTANGNLDASSYKEFVQSTKNKLKLLSDSANGTMDATQLAFYIEGGLAEIFQTTESFKDVLRSVAKQDEILRILAIAKPDFTKIDSKPALSPLQDVTFLTVSLMWYEFLDKLALRLCKGHTLWLVNTPWLFHVEESILPEK